MKQLNAYQRIGNEIVRNRKSYVSCYKAFKRYAHEGDKHFSLIWFNEATRINKILIILEKEYTCEKEEHQICKWPNISNITT